MTNIIRVYRERPITRPGQVERLLIKFGIGPHRSYVYPTPPEQVLAEWFKNATPTGFILTAEQSKNVSAGYDVTEGPNEYASTVIVEQRKGGGGSELDI